MHFAQCSEEKPGGMHPYIRGCMQKDVVSINYFEDPVRFADLINGYIYHEDLYKILFPFFICSLAGCTDFVSTKDK